MTITVVLLVISFVLALIGATIAGVLVLLRQAVEVIRKAALDSVDVYTRAQTAKLDVATGHARLDYWQQVAESKLHERRQQLLAGSGNHPERGEAQ